MRSYATACPRLPPPTSDLLDLASVAGPEFELETLRRAASHAGSLSALEGLEPAGSELIEEIPSRSIAYRFTHELVRRALYDRLSEAPSGRAAPPRRRGARGAAHRRDHVLADLAHHFTVAAALGGREQAITYNLLAAEAATAALDHDEATARLRTALEARHRRRASASRGMARARRRLCSSRRELESIHAYREAGEIARAIRDGELLAQAAVGFEEACWRPGMLDQRAVEFLEEASAALPAGTRCSALAFSPASLLAWPPRAAISGAPSSAGTRSRWRAGSTTARALPRCSCTPTGLAARRRSRTSWRC